MAARPEGCHPNTPAAPASGFEGRGREPRSAGGLQKLDEARELVFLQSRAPGAGGTLPAGTPALTPHVPPFLPRSNGSQYMWVVLSRQT